MYKKNVSQVIERMSLLINGKAREQIFAKISLPSQAIEKYKKTHLEGEVAYPDLESRHEFWDSYIKEVTSNPDDSAPVAYMSEFDEGLYTGLMGAEVRYLDNPDWGWISSMSIPFVNNAEELLDLKLDENSKLAQQYLNQLKFFKQKSKGNYGISHFILIDGCNALMELRGATNMFYDTIDDPDIVRNFFKKVRELNFWVQDNFFDNIGLFEGGTFSNLCQWCPGKIVSESLDPFHMAGIDFFEEWGRENVQMMFDHYDGGVIHIHTGLGLHLVHPASSLGRLKMMAFIDEEFNEKKAWCDLEQIDKDRGSIPITLSIPLEVFEDRIKKNTLPGNILYQVDGVKTLDQANYLMEKVYSYRR